MTRAKRICYPSLLSEELDKLRDIFISTGYPLSIIDRYMQHRNRQVSFGPNNCGLYSSTGYICSTRLDNRTSFVISSAFLALNLLCCFSSRSTFSTKNDDVLPLPFLSNLVYSVTFVRERKYNGKTIQRLSYRIKQHVPLTLTNAGLVLRSAGQGGVVLSLPSEEQVVLDRQLADSRSNSAITRHHRSNHDCLIAVCFHVFDLFSVV